MAATPLRQAAYQTIKDNIVQCRYEPGSFLGEEQLCQELGMSRTPIRDALGRLEQEGLVRIMPKKGLVISPVTLNELNMVFEARLLLEPYIVENYCSHLPAETLEAMAECIKQASASSEGNDLAFYDWDNTFHNHLISRCTNSYFVRLLSDINAQNTRIRVLSGRASEERRSNTISEHLKILNALVKDDTKQAAQLMHEHLLSSKDASFSPLGIQNLPYR